MVLLQSDQFLVRLTRMFEKSRDGNGPGTIRITMKRTSVPPEMKSETESDHVCLIRVKVGQKRANVMVPFEEHARFQTNIANLLRVYLDGLKKRDKSETQNKTRSRRVA